MSNDDLRPAENSSDTSQNAQQAQPRPAPERRSLFSIPPPLKRVFDKFPLITYGENGLPLRAPAWREEHTLYVFATDRGAKSGRPSFNPACLKWQVSLIAISLHEGCVDTDAMVTDVFEALESALQDCLIHQPCLSFWHVTVLTLSSFQRRVGDIS